MSWPVRWLRPPTERIERSGRVNGTMGRGLEVKKEDKAEKLENYTGAAGVRNKGRGGGEVEGGR